MFSEFVTRLNKGVSKAVFLCTPVTQNSQRFCGYSGKAPWPERTVGDKLEKWLLTHWGYITLSQGSPIRDPEIFTSQFITGEKL